MLVNPGLTLLLLINLRIKAIKMKKPATATNPKAVLLKILPNQ